MTKEDALESQPLARGSEQTDDSDFSQVEEETTAWQEGRRRGSRRVSVLLIAACFAASNVISVAIGAYLGRMTMNLDTECAAHTTHYSPVLKGAGIKYAPTKFNGTFMVEDVYRRKGAPDVDAAWEALGVDYRAGVIPAEEGLKSGLTPAHVQRSAKYGGGFFVNVEGLHHLHCLNLIRKSLYYNYDYYKALGTHAFKNEDDIIQLHVSHCLDTVRQVLMCNADTGVLGQVWYDKEKPAAFPDFHTTHTCKNYDAIRQWGEKLQEVPPDELPSDYMAQPKSEDVLPATP